MLLVFQRLLRLLDKVDDVTVGRTTDRNLVENLVKLHSLRILQETVDDVRPLLQELTLCQHSGSRGLLFIDLRGRREYQAAPLGGVQWRSGWLPWALEVDIEGLDADGVRAVQLLGLWVGDSLDDLLEASLELVLLDSAEGWPHPLADAQGRLKVDSAMGAVARRIHHRQVSVLVPGHELGVSQIPLLFDPLLQDRLLPLPDELGDIDAVSLGVERLPAHRESPRGFTLVVRAPLVVDLPPLPGW